MYEKIDTNDPTDALKQIMESGPYVVFAYFWKYDAMLNAILELPYTQVANSEFTTRKGTKIMVQEGAKHEDGSVGYVFLTGGDITHGECQKVIEAVKKYGQYRFHTQPH